MYTISGTPLTHELKCLAAAMRLPPTAMLTGLSSATLHGAALADFSTPVDVIVPREYGMHRRQGLRCSAVRTYDFEHSPWHGIRLAGIERTAFDLLKRRSMALSIAHCDALLHANLITAEGIAKFVSGRGDDGVVLARQRIPYLDGRAESIPESVLRVELNLRGLDPVPQFEVIIRRRFVARVDLAFPAERVAVEYDGHWHADPDQFRQDEARRKRLFESGWIVIVVTNKHIQRSMEPVVESIHEALARRRNHSFN
ncbi:endonuclease domain-containing protein [Saccharopolyspora hattusasensis]|uniref:endonuclease domain-containing protein n=1 Tax=Saccharopolyspora hattusasensis TaxID=1128679 RepID=UPI003D96FD95